MSMKKPKIRFKGYTEDWEQRKLGDICQVIMGQSPDGSTYSEEPSDYILVQGNADLKDGWVEPRIWTTQKTKTAQAGDLIMSVRAPAGTMGKTAYDVVLGRGVAGIKGNEFVYQSLVKMDSDGYWKKMAAGSTFESINSDVVKNAEMPIPQDIEEQGKNGLCFMTLDHLITLHQRKCNQAKKLKKYMLQKMFPQNGEKIPEIRFDGFTDDWEQRKLGEVLKERSERAIGDEELLSVTIGNVVIKQVDSDKRNTASEDKSNYKKVRKGDLPYNSMRMWQGAVGNSEYEGIVSPAYTVLVPTDESNSKFFEELFKKKSTLQIFQRWSQGLTSDTWNLKYPALSTIRFFIPSVEEQTKIAEYFSSLDQLITLHQRKCDEMKKIKKFMLQNMFV